MDGDSILTGRMDSNINTQIANKPAINRSVTDYVLVVPLFLLILILD